MKAILMSIKPQHVANILNELKTQEIRKRFPNDYVGWVYIYVTKDQNEELWWYDGTEDFRLYKKGIANERDIGWHLQNGKVVARFWVDKVESLHIKHGIGWETETIKGTQEIEKVTCVDRYNLYRYCKGKAFAIHITKLEIFEKPKEIKEFKHIETKQHYAINGSKTYKEYFAKPLTRAPQSWQFIEVDL